MRTMIDIEHGEMAGTGLLNAGPSGPGGEANEGESARGGVFSVSFYQQFFDVDTVDVIGRLETAAKCSRFSSNLVPDL